MARVRYYNFLSIWNLCGHIVSRSEECRIVRSDNDQSRDLDVRKRFHDAGIALGQHATGSSRQACSGTMRAHRHLSALRLKRG